MPPQQGGLVDEDDISKGYDIACSRFLSLVVGVGAGDQVRQDGRRLAAHQDPVSLDLYGPHGMGDTICGGTIARGLQGQLPGRFCLKKGCGQVKFGTAAARGLLCQGEQCLGLLRALPHGRGCGSGTQGFAQKLQRHGGVEGQHPPA